MNGNILEDLERTVARVPDRIAFFDDQTALTFGQLMNEARAVGSCLARSMPLRGVAALLMDGRSLRCVPAFLGAAYAGGAYAPLDPAMPASRLEMILEPMRPDLILADEKGLRALCALEKDMPVPVIGYAHAAGESIDPPLLEERRRRTGMFDPLSILYTSGSTGVPKGSVQCHASYIHYTQATIEVYGFDEAVVFGNQSPFYYANSIIDIYPPIALGASVYLLPSNSLVFPAQLIQRLRKHHVTELTMTPSSFIAVANADVLEPGCLPQLRWGIMSGEAMPWTPLRKWMKAAHEAGFYNFYGSTEAFSVAVGRVTGEYAEGERLPVGEPFRQANLLFLNDDGKEADPREGGEMLVSNPWLSSGYHRDPERTAEAFVIDPMERGYFERFYRTGDIGRLNERGELVVLGRRDAQIKHHGYRMELGEVEQALSALPGLLESCVLFDRATGLMHCFWTGEWDANRLRAGLRRRLPRYMLPDRYTRLDAMPHTATMKIDRMALRRIAQNED